MTAANHIQPEGFEIGKLMSLVDVPAPAVQLGQAGGTLSAAKQIRGAGQRELRPASHLRDTEPSGELALGDLNGDGRKVRIAISALPKSSAALVARADVLTFIPVGDAKAI